MTDSLKAIGKDFARLATAKDRPAARPFTASEEYALLSALQSIVNVDDITLVLVDESPYDSVEALRLDVVMNQRFQTPMLSCPGMMSDSTYTLYRMYHDIRNHVLQNKSFSPFDELMSGIDLITELRDKVPKYVIDFIFTDVILMNSVYAYSPKRWQKLENGTNHRVCCFDTYRASSLLLDSKA